MTVKQVFDRAMALINERDSTGEFHSDVGDFEKNAPELINTLVTLMLPDDCILKGLKPSEASWEVAEVHEMGDVIPLHDALVGSVLPLGLASFLLLEEDSARAEYFFDLYKSARVNITSVFKKGTRGSVRNIY